MLMATPPIGSPPFFFLKPVNRSAAIPCVLLKDKNRDCTAYSYTKTGSIARTPELIMNALYIPKPQHQTYMPRQR